MPPSVAVFGAAGLHGRAGGAAARAPPGLRADGADRAQRRRPAAWMTSTRTTAFRSCWRSSISTIHARVDAAVVAYPHGAAAPLVAELRERGVRVVDLSADFRIRDVAVYEQWYAPHTAPQLIAAGRLRPAGAVSRPSARRGSGRQPRLLPDRDAAGARAAGARGRDRRGRRRRQVGRLRRRARRHRQDPFRDRRRERQRVRGSPPPPHARDRAGAGGARRRGDDHLHAAPAAAGPG